MQILHVDTGRSMRGGQHQLLLLLRGLEQRGHQQTLLAREPLLSHWPGERAGYLALRHAAQQAEVIHAHDARAHNLAALAGADKPLVVSRRVAFPPRRGPASRWKYSRASCFIAVSEHVKGQLLAAGIPASRITVVYDGAPVSGEFRRPVRGAEPLVVTPKHSDPLKGTELLRSACNKARVPLLESPALADDLKKASLFVYLSASEGLGSAILFAMAHSVPVIASRVGGIPEIVEHEVTGLLVDNQVEQIAAAIQRLSRDEALASQCAERAYLQVLERFTDDIMVRQTEEVYRAILAG